jgi:hypothetical protein
MLISTRNDHWKNENYISEIEEVPCILIECAYRIVIPNFNFKTKALTGTSAYEILDLTITLFCQTIIGIQTARDYKFSSELLANI